MWIVAVAWIYVVGLMALTETSIVAGVMTFLGYCVVPLSILYYLTGSKRRAARRAAKEAQQRPAQSIGPRTGSDPD
jgi:small-conductance mechanosensitive channel